MKPAYRRFSALAVSLGLVLAPAASQGEAQLTTLAPATSGANSTNSSVRGVECV